MLKLKNSLLVITIAASILASCDKKDKNNAEKTANGLEYILHSHNKGEKIKKGDVVTLHFTMKNSKDSTISSSYAQGKPVPLPVREPMFKGSIEEGLVLMTKGDSGTFWVSADSLFKGAPMPPFVAKGSKLKFDIKVINVQNEQDFQKERMETMQKEQQKIQEEVARHKTIDDSIIRSYVGANKLNAQKTSSGLYYIVDNPGKGAKPAEGDSITVHYTLTLTDGTKIESSKDRGQPATFVVGQVIPGWNEGLQFFKEGGSGKLIIPSELAYRNSPIGPQQKTYQVLLFDIELLKVRKNK